MKKFTCLLVISLVLTLPEVFSQNRKNKNKVLPVKGIVTVRGGSLLPRIFPSEETENIWNDYKSEKYNFTIQFPAKKADIWADEIESVETFATFETQTKKANYRLIIKSLNADLDNSQLDELYESSFADNLNSSRVKIISKRNVYLNRRLGKEFVYSEKGEIHFQRFFIQEKKLFLATVNLPEKQYTKDFDRWAIKFLDSLIIETKENDVG